MTAIPTQPASSPAAAASPPEPVVFEAEPLSCHPWFECTSAQWDEYTVGMTDRGRRLLANLLAHHCLPARRDRFGWLLTRFDLVAAGRPFWHASNAGVLTYDYDPDTAHAESGRPPEPLRDAAWRGQQIRRIREFSTRHLRDGAGALDALYQLAVDHGADPKVAAGHAHNANGALNEMQGAVFNLATLAAHPIAPDAVREADG